MIFDVLDGDMNCAAEDANGVRHPTVPGFAAAVGQEPVIGFEPPGFGKVPPGAVYATRFVLTDRMFLWFTTLNASAASSNE